MNHLKQTGHQPAPEIEHPKSTIIKCYTCKSEFKSKWELMNHRRDAHPTNRKCRYFLKGECVFQDDCWYSHETPKLTGTKPQANHSPPNQPQPGNVWQTQPSDFQFPPLHTLPPDQTNNIMMTFTTQVH